ncbi:MAG TPA: tetratricopeptide repeat protein [Bryobacteraceae bacterium]|nr:tetratricopeptide repeat protein [Bryobacteraceae bacterium]
MSSHLKSFILSAFAVLLASVPAFSQVTGVEGYVKDENGKPLQGAVINFDRTDIKGHYPVKSDKKGHYGHYGLPNGVYTVTVVVDGKTRDTVNGFHTGFGDPKQLNFDLKQSADQAKALAAAADSGKLTAEQERGMSKEQKEQFDKAAKAREAQLAKNKALNDAYTTGKNAVDAKQWDAAIDSLNKAAEMDAKQGAVWTTLADAYVGKAQATPAEASANYDKAFDAFKKAIEVSPTDAGLYNNYALALAKDKKLDDAKTNLAKAAELDPPGAGKYYYNLGALLVNSNQNDAALEQFRKAVQADPNYADAQYQLGMTLAAKASTDASGKITPAPGTVEALQKYLELKPDGVNAQSAKEMLAALGGSVSENYSNPNAPKGKGAPTKKK